MPEDAAPSSIVVVGAGLAGLRTVEQLRRRNFTGRITLVGAEAHLPYDRPPLSKQVLRGEQDHPWLRRREEYSELDVDLHVGGGALGVDLERRIVFLAAAELPYEALVVATGAVPRRIPDVGGSVLRTWDDAVHLRESLRPGAQLTVIGAGLVGCEVAASARAMDVEVDLVDVLPGPLARVAGSQVSSLVADLHRAHGVRMHLGRGVTRNGDGRIELDDGVVLPSDHVLQAVGARPDTDWLAGSGVTLEDGVVCDDVGHAVEGVWAVGDVARWAGLRHEHWTSAGEQADRVAAAILGQSLPSTPVPYWWSDQYDLKIQGVGATGADDGVALVEWGPKARTLALYSRGGRLTGAVGFSAPAAVLKLRAAIGAGVELAEVRARLGV